MISLPPNNRRVFCYRVCKIAYTDGTTGYRCFGYEGPVMNDWVMSTHIDFSTVKKLSNDVSCFMFSTESGSTYQVSDYCENPIGPLLKEALCKRYNAATITELSEKEAVELFTNGVE